MAEEQKKDEKKEKKKRTLLQKIVNVFLYIGLGIFLLLVIAFAVSQTSFFRNWLREKAMSAANDALNGQVYIGQLDGTIFTSLILHDTYITMDSDTLLNASRIELRTSPLQLLLKKIYVRKLELDSTQINLIRDRDGTLNLSKLVPPSNTTDTTSSSFPFKILVAELKIKNSGFSLRDYNISSKTSYDGLNLHNLMVENLNLTLTAFADINKKDFEAGIHSLSFNPNINGFAVKKLSGELYLNSDSINVRDFSLKTDSSDFTINALVKNFSIFDSTKNNDFTKADLNLQLDADKFSFSDLSVFVPSTDILHGTINAEIKTSGSFKLLYIGQLEVSYRNTHLAAGGQIENLDAGEDMEISIAFQDTYIKQEDINALLPSLNTPVYEGYGTLRFDTLTYKGKPLDFNTGIKVITDKGSFAVNGNLNFENNPMTYDLNFHTDSLDIAPFAGVSSDITSRGSIKGKGVKPDSLNASVKFFAGGSVVDGNRMDTLRLVADAKNKNIEYKLTAVSDTLLASLEGSFDFTKKALPGYELDGEVKNLNLARFTNDSLQTDLNFSLQASGEGFNPDSMNLFLSTTLYNSSIKGIEIDSTRAIVDLRKNDGGERVVNLISDLADITLTGEFTVTDAVGLMTSEMKIVTNAVKDKLNKLIPSDIGVDSVGIVVSDIPSVETTRQKTRMDYVIEFKDFQLLSLFLGGKQLELDGDVQGKLEETADSLNFTFNTNLDYLKYWGKNDVFFLSKLNLNLALHNNLHQISLSHLNADVDLSIERIFTGSDIKDLKLGLNVKDDSAAVQFSVDVENYLTADIDSRMHFVDNGVEITFDTLSAVYNQFDLENRKPVIVEYSPDSVQFKNFELFHKNGSIALDGILKRKGSQDLKIKMQGITGNEISETLVGLRPDNSIQSSLKFSADIKGSFDSPVMKINLSADSVQFKNTNFGSLVAQLNYEDKNLNTDIRFIDSLRNMNHPLLKISGSLPLDLAFSGAEQRLIETKPVNIDVEADSFRMGALGNMLPEINRIRGKLTAKLHLGGTFKNFEPEGHLVLDNADFVVAKNNLEYNAGLKLSLTPDQLKIDSLLIKNTPNTKNGGQMTGNGYATIKNLQIVNSNFNISGELKVLSESSRSASPSVYGDLVISTQGNIEFKLDSSGAFISVPIVVKDADLTFPPTESAYENTSKDFIYVYAADTSAPEKGGEADLQRLVDLSHRHNESQQNKSVSGFSFDYKIDVHVEKEAKINFVLSKELNQNLTAILRGDFHYEKINGKSDASGQLNLLNGSTLEFLKTFEAGGSIRFENQLDNPYLDITATYTDYYYPAGDSVSNNEVKVAVKITIKGFLKDLGKNLVQNQNNIAVYYGANNIENNNPDPTKTASDAVLFILAGKFTEGATQQDRNAAASTAASLAGSVVGGFLNKRFGDIVRRVELRQVGSQTRFNLVGKAGDINYSIGGSTNVFQDITQANVKLEYPITNQLLIRLERKPSVTETSANINEMINELALKYKFEF